MPGPGPNGAVHVDPEIFSGGGRPQRAKREQIGGHWQTDPAFLVVTPDQERALLPLYRAGQRFYLVGESGREHAQPDVDEYTPNWVSDIYLTEEGLVLLVDTKGELSPEMGDTMLRILTEELVADAVPALITAPPLGFTSDLESIPTWTPPTSPSTAQDDESRRGG